MQAVRGWVFDLDGTLTIAQHDFPAIRLELGIPADQDILGYIAAQPELERRALDAWLDAIEMRLAAEVEAAEGAAELIRDLHGRGVRLGILTRNLQGVARRSLEVLGVLDCFAPADVLGRGEALPKPHPDGIHQLADRWGLAAKDMIMVGDYRFDLEAGRAAGCQTCLLHPENLWPDLTDWHLPDCGSLLQQLHSR
jgi:HAD superfamily hydrolase (TIGR01509 family)